MRGKGLTGWGKASWTLTTTWFESTLLWHTLQSLKRRAGAQSPSGHHAPSPAGPSVESFSSGDAPPATKRADVKNSPTSRKTTAFLRTSASSGSQHPAPAFLEPQGPPVASCTTSGGPGAAQSSFQTPTSAHSGPPPPPPRPQHPQITSESLHSFAAHSFQPSQPLPIFLDAQKQPRDRRIVEHVLGNLLAL